MAHRQGSFKLAAWRITQVIRTESFPQAYRTRVMNDGHELASDAPLNKGGDGAGFGPHELLEAALAACINMAVRMHANQHSIPLRAVTTRVTLDRAKPGIVCFEYSMDMEGPLSSDQCRQLERAAEECPVRKTLSSRLEFKALGVETRP